MRIVRLGLITALVSLIVLCSPSPAYAQIGVGVNLGKISVDKPLSPGGTYHLPSVSVINTGEEASDYEVEVTYHYEQKELRPPADWVKFDPKTFHLEPGESQPVAITLSIPVRAEPGDYFAYIEAHPIVKEEGVAIGVAAATKLYFTVKPSNIFTAIWHRIKSFFETNAPISYIIPGVVGLILVFFLSRRFVRVRVRVESKR